MTSPSRAAVLERLAITIADLPRDCPARIAVDGTDGAGKTTLADELAFSLSRHRRPVIRGSIDSFHRSRAARYARGSDSPEGFYHDSFDYERLRSLLLDPLGPGGSRRYCTAAFDWRTDTPVETVECGAAKDSVLVFDGIFSQRPELAGTWNLTIFLDVDFKEALRRSLVRDHRELQTALELEQRFWKRYAAGQRLYFAEADPRSRADVLIDNNDPENPRIVRPCN